MRQNDRTPITTHYCHSFQSISNNDEIPLLYFLNRYMYTCMCIHLYTHTYSCMNIWKDIHVYTYIYIKKKNLILIPEEQCLGNVATLRHIFGLRGRRYITAPPPRAVDPPRRLPAAKREKGDGRPFNLLFTLQVRTRSRVFLFRHSRTMVASHRRR